MQQNSWSSGPWESLTNELERAYQTILDVTQVYFGTTLITGNAPYQPPKYIMAGHSGGELRLFSFDSVVRNPSSLGDDVNPVLSVKAHHGPVYNISQMNLGDDILILSCGYDGMVCGWSWGEILSSAIEQPSVKIPTIQPRFRVQVPKIDKGEGEMAVNAIGIDEHNKRFFAGDGGGFWHMWNLGQLNELPEMKVQSHSAMILDVQYSPRNALLATSSEDGTVCIWDCRHRSHLSAIDPSRGLKLPTDFKQRTRGRYPFAPCIRFDPDSNWLLCGSSKKIVSFWNIRANMSVQQLQTEAIPHAINTHGNEVLVVGEEPLLNRYNLQGQKISCTEIVPEVSYSLEVDPNTKMVVVAGTESSIQVVSPEGQSLGKVTSRKMLDVVGDNAHSALISDSDEEFLGLVGEMQSS